jgi:hypothetical protein
MLNSKNEKMSNLGNIKDSIDVLQKMIDYLSQNPKP